MPSIKKNSFAKIKVRLRAYFIIAIPFIIIFISLRFYDFINIYSISDELLSFSDLVFSLGNDFMLALSISGLGLIFFMLLSILSKNFARIIIYLIFGILLISYIAFIQYFENVLVPLDQVLFIYSFNDIINIAVSSGPSNFFDIIVYFIAILLFILGGIILSKQIIPKVLIGIFTFAIIASGASTNLYIVYQNQFNGELSFYCNSNKLIYFIKATTHYFKTNTKINKKEIETFTKTFHNINLHNKEYKTNIFPFLFKEDHKCTISKYFEPLDNNEKPNIVFIIVESLSHSVSGKYTSNESFTPFLDSLAKKSLYWRNCLSTSERTFGVLPAVLASLPPAESGFMRIKKPFPYFLSLPKFLKQNGYFTQMFYGGWPGFTNMDNFVKATGIDSIYWHFNNYKKMPKSANGHTWGYGDKALFNGSEQYLNSDTSYFSIYLTLSTHKPFNTHEPEYMKNYTDSLINTITDNNTKKIAKEKAKNLKLFTVLDNEIKLFIQRYKNRPEYHKTIFIITGDHKSIIFNSKNGLDKYYVPLIIYSPLLNKHQEFGGLTTHNDIFPTIQNLLFDKYKLKSSEYSNYIGFQLDTSISFHTNNCLFPMRNSREISEFIYKQHYYNNGQLYLISDTMNTTLIENENLKQKMYKQMEEFNKLQSYTIRNRALYSPKYIYESIHIPK